MKGPVYLIASERSGTNLIRKRITENQSVYFGPSPGHFLKNLYFQEPFYGDLENNSNFLKMIEDALLLVTVHFSPWEFSLTAEEILREYPFEQRSSIYLAHYLMTEYAKQKGFQTYFCKDNFLYEFALDIANKLPEAKFIYLYRDARDFVVSQLNRPQAIKCIYHYSKLWEYEQTRSIRVACELKASGRCFWISYEDFIQNEEENIIKLIDFLGVEKKESKVEESMAQSVHEWKNISKSTMSTNSGKYKQALSEKKIRVIEGICNKQMNYLGYSADFPDGKVINNLKAKSMLKLLLSAPLIRIANLFRKSDLGNMVSARAKLLQRLFINYRSPGA